MAYTRRTMKLYRLAKPLLFRLEPEHAHVLVGGGWSALMQLPGTERLTARLRYAHPALRCEVAGMAFANPLGLAGGFDKDGRYLAAMARLGFGFLELGTVTPRPQAGNQQPRLFRLPEDGALINRMGFNNAGAEALAARLRASGRRLPIGVNIGKNRDTPPEQAPADYLACLRALGPLADYFVVNVSSPNTPGLRDLQRREALAEILALLRAERTALGLRLPIFVKLSPDETPAQLEAALAVLLDGGADGIVATNTTTERPASLAGAARVEAGGLSGRPLRARATATVRQIYRATGGRLPIIGVGGVEDAAGAYEKILAGASLVQLYTALVYQGPGLVAEILRGLAELLARDGFTSVGEAVGQLAADQ
jgi:dihydroorotate dehydrogenase